MAQRRKHDPGTRSGERRDEGQKRQPAGRDPSKERGGKGESDSGRSWVHDEPPLEQRDPEPHRTGYSDRETPETKDEDLHPRRPAEGPAPKR